MTNCIRSPLVPNRSPYTVIAGRNSNSDRISTSPTTAPHKSETLWPKGINFFLTRSGCYTGWSYLLLPNSFRSQFDYHCWRWKLFCIFLLQRSLVIAIISLLLESLQTMRMLAGTYYYRLPSKSKSCFTVSNEWNVAWRLVASVLNLGWWRGRRTLTNFSKCQNDFDHRSWSEYLCYAKRYFLKQCD